MIDKAYFVSDLHLGSDKEPSGLLFTQFLDCCAEEKPKYLFLLGDIFDMWLADHAVYEKRYQNIIEAISRVRNAGTEIHFFEGNHDLFLDYYFTNKMKLIVHKGPIEMNLFGKNLRIEHGDQMDPDDKGYIFLRWFLRTPVLNWLAPRVPTVIVQQIGDRGSEMSRGYSRSSALSKEVQEQIRQKIRKHVFREASKAQSDFEICISGHMHVEDDYEFEVGGRKIRSINLGTWLNRPIAVELTSQSLRWIELNDPMKVGAQ